MIFSLIKEFRSQLIQQCQQIEKNSMASDEIKRTIILDLERSLLDVLDNCIHVSHLREQGLISELIISINDFYLVPKTLYSTQKIATVYIKLMAILNQIETKEQDHINSKPTNQKMDLFKYSVFALQTLIKHAIDYPELSTYLIFHILHMILIKMNFSAMSKYELQITLNSLMILAKSKIFENHAEQCESEFGANDQNSESVAVRDLDFFDIYSKMIVANLGIINQRDLLNLIWLKFLRTGLEIYKFLQINPQKR